MATQRSEEHGSQPRRRSDRHGKSLKERLVRGLQRIKALVRQDPLPDNRQSQLLPEERPVDEQ